MVRLDHYTRRVVIAFSIAAAFFIAWRSSDVFVLLFGGLILAIALRAVAGGVSRFAPLPERGALAVVVVGLLVLLGVVIWLIGGRVAIQFEELRSTLPRAITAASEWLNSSRFGLTLLDFWESAKEGGVPWSRVAIFTTVAIGGVVNAVLMVAIRLYLAASPGLYYRGFLRLVPGDIRQRVVLEYSKLKVTLSRRSYNVGRLLCHRYSDWCRSSFSDCFLD